MNAFEKLELGGARAAVLGGECCGSAAVFMSCLHPFTHLSV